MSSPTTVTHVIVYATSWCPDCHRSLRLLKRLGIEHAEIDIEKVEGAEAAMRGFNGGSGKVPTILVGQRVLVEPTDAELEAAFSQ